MRVSGALLLLLLCGTVRAAPPDGTQAQQLLRQSIDLYVTGRYAEAVRILRPLVESRVLRDAADQLEALRTYGISLYLTGARPGAERAFRDLLRLDSTARLDPAFVRPEVVTFFEHVRRTYGLELTAVERRGSTSAAVNLLPPWGQFQNGHHVKGYLVLCGELAFGLTSITTAALLYSWRDSETRQFPQHEDAYRPISMVNYVAFGLAVGVVVYGIIDGLYYHYRRPMDRRAWLAPPKRQPIPPITSGGWDIH